MSKRRYTSFLEVLAEAEGSWPGATGQRRREEVRAVIEAVCSEYGAAFGITKGQVFAAIEAQRDYFCCNYYQRANFPPLHGVTVYETPEHFRSLVGDQGFRCPACKHVSKSPYECDSGAYMAPGKVCDWKSYGLFGCLGRGHTALLRSEFPANLRPVTMFMPIALEASV